jgi:hypothetical protein
MRDKLIELIDSNKACDLKRNCYECQYNNEPTCFPARLADALIANGVTFADVPDTNVGKWIPVSEQPCDGEEFANVCIYYMEKLADFHGYIMAHKVKAHIIRLLQAEAEGRLAIMSPNEGE